jgi:hypothetical protein
MLNLHPIPEEKSSDILAEKTPELVPQPSPQIYIPSMFKYPYQQRMDKVISIIKISESRSIKKHLLEEFVREEWYLMEGVHPNRGYALYAARKELAEIELLEANEELLDLMDIPEDEITEENFSIKNN